MDPFHDGALPPPEDAQRHVDGSAYRLAAIRETFEESGILLARNNGFGRLIEVEDNEREAGRKIIHNREMPFEKWLAGKGGRADVGAHILIHDTFIGLFQANIYHRRSHPIHTLGHTYQHTQEIHHANVHLFSTPLYAI